MTRTRTSLLAAAAVVVAGVAWLIMTPRTVLFTVSPDPSMVRPRTYAAMNPFRDRSPERAAERCLAELAKGRLACAGRVDDRIIDGERRHPIVSWRIARRKDSADGTRLTYWVRRGNGYPDEEEVYLDVAGSGDRARVIRFSALY